MLRWHVSREDLGRAGDYVDDVFSMVIGSAVNYSDWHHL